MNGVNQRVLKIDLTNQKTQVVDIDDTIYMQFGMGAGIGSYFLYKEVPPGIDPLGPDNVIIISPGLFVGTGIPTGSKTVVLFKSPLTGGFGRAVVGGYLGVSLRKAGYDALILKGQSKIPVILKINDDNVEYIDATPHIGLDAIQVQETLRQMYGDQYRTCAIGQAGSNLSLIAGIDFEERQAARGGGGAVLGSKKVKAIMISGTGEIPVHDSEKLKTLIAKWRKVLKDHPTTQDDMNYGSGEWLGRSHRGSS